MPLCLPGCFPHHILLLFVALSRHSQSWYLCSSASSSDHCLVGPSSSNRTVLRSRQILRIGNTQQKIGGVVHVKRVLSPAVVNEAGSLLVRQLQKTSSLRNAQRNRRPRLLFSLVMRCALPAKSSAQTWHCRDAALPCICTQSPQYRFLARHRHQADTALLALAL